MRSAARFRAVQRAFGSFSVVLGLARLGVAQEPTKAECASAYEGGQELRAQGRLIEARERLVVCAQEACPAFVQSDCATWLMDVEEELPTVVVVAKGPDGRDAVDVRVSVDGELLLHTLDGKAVPIDPGLHEFRFEYPGADAVSKQILVRQGQKNRAIEVSFARNEPAAAGRRQTAIAAEPSPHVAALPAEDETTEPGAGPGPLRPYAYAAGGVGAAGVVTWAVLGLVGRGQQRELDKSCKPSCSQKRVDPIDRKYLAADISLLVGLAGLGTGVALFILSMPEASEPAADASGIHVDVIPLRGGGAASVRGRF